MNKNIPNLREPAEKLHRCFLSKGDIKILKVNFIVILFILVPLWLLFRGKKYVNQLDNFNVYREIIINIFFVYILGVIYVTLRPFHFIIPLVIGKSFTFDFNLFYNLKNMVDSYVGYQLLYSLGNILMLVPFGLLVPILFKSARYFYKMILFGFACSLTIELTQTFFTTTRSGTVDDLVFNTMGAAIGYVLFLIAQSLSQRSKLINKFLQCNNRNIADNY